MGRPGLFAALLLSVLLLSPKIDAAQTETYASARQGLPLFGRLGSARLAGLAGSFNAFSVGPDALLGNPAGLSKVKGLSVGAHHESWLADINQETLFAVTPVGDGQAFGAYVHVIDYGVFELRDASGQRQGSLSARDYAVGAAYGLRSRRGFSGGVGLRGLRQSLVKDDYFGLAMDCGLGWEGDDGWSGGLAAVNVGTSINGVQGAESVRWGVARRFDWAGHWFWPGLGFTWEPHVTPKMAFGAEFGLAGNLDLRIGYEHRFVETLIDGVQGLTLGLGFRVAGFSLDYAFLPQGDLGSGHRLSLVYTQPLAPAKVRPARAPAPPVPVPPAEAAPVPLPPALQPAPAPRAALQETVDPLEEARSLEAEGRLGEALSEYERVTQARPELEGAWRGLADLAYRLRSKAKALDAYGHLLRLRPNPDLARWVEAYRQEPEQP